MPRSYAQLYQAIPQARNDPEARARAVAELLSFVRHELDSPHTDADRIRNGIEILQRHGTIEDVPRLSAVIARGRSQDDLGFAREVRRQVQERCFMLAEISKEEEELLRTSTPTLKSQQSKWIAVRLGRIVAESIDRSEIELEIAKLQGKRSSPYVPLVVPVGNALPNVHERR